MEFWVRRNQPGDFLIADLGQTVPGSSDFNLGDYFIIEILETSADLDAAFTANELERIDGFGGDPIPEINTSAMAGGDLGGSYPNPKVVAITEVGDPTRLVIAAIADGEFLRRSGDSIVGNVGTGGGGSLEAETLTYTNTSNKVLGPLSITPLAPGALTFWPITGVIQDVVVDYTVREVIGGSAPGYYVCISPTSTAPGGGSFSGGNNPGSGIDAILTSGDKARVIYPT